MCQAWLNMNIIIVQFQMRSAVKTFPSDVMKVTLRELFSCQGQFEVENIVECKLSVLKTTKCSLGWISYLQQVSSLTTFWNELKPKTLGSV